MLISPSQFCVYYVMVRVEVAKNLEKRGHRFDLRLSRYDLIN